LFFPKAIQHIFVGMYVQQVFLTALFFLAQDENGRQSAIPMGALMVVLIFCTGCFNLVIAFSYGPLEKALPLSLADKTYDANHPIPSEEDLGPEPSTTSNPRTSEDIIKVENGGLEPTNVEAKPKDPEAEEDEDLHDFTIDGPRDFDHPASVETQRIVWVPDDVLGLGKAEVEDMMKRSIQASLEKTEMDDKGKIKITGPPPGGPEVNVE